jgi:hypothetical protein
MHASIFFKLFYLYFEADEDLIGQLAQLSLQLVKRIRLVQAVSVLSQGEIVLFGFTTETKPQPSTSSGSRFSKTTLIH